MSKGNRDRAAGTEADRPHARGQIGTRILWEILQRQLHLEDQKLFGSSQKNARLSQFCRLLTRFLLLRVWIQDVSQIKH